jgi:hypothetical protein
MIYFILIDSYNENDPKNIQILKMQLHALDLRNGEMKNYANKN